MVKCGQCGNEYNAVEREGRCPFCGQVSGTFDGGSATMNARTDTAWERRSSWLDFPALFEMIRGVLLDPVNTFRRMKLAGDMGSPLLFALILSTIGMLGALFWNVAMQGMGMFAGQHRINQFAFSTGLMLVLTIFSPVFVLLGTFISSGILHVCLLITGGAKNGFEATFRVVAYASGATAPFHLVPFCGGLIGGIWAIVAQVIGVREMHETTTGRALAAVLLPIIFCCGCALVLLTFGIGAGIFSRVLGR